MVPSLTRAAQAGAGATCACARRFASVGLDLRHGALRRVPGEQMFEPTEEQEAAPKHIDRRGFFRGAAALTVGGFGAAVEVAAPSAQTNGAAAFRPLVFLRTGVPRAAKNVSEI